MNKLDITWMECFGLWALTNSILDDLSAEPPTWARQRVIRQAQGLLEVISEISVAL